MYHKFSISHKMRKNPKRLSLSFLAIALIFSAVFFSFLVSKNRNYRATISVIFIPKSEKASFDSRNIIGNMELIPHKLFFYDKLIADNENIEDIFSGLSGKEREKLWNKKIETERENRSSVVNISTTGENLEAEENISQAAAFTLFNILSHYYDIKKDIDLRIIDGPAAVPYVKNTFWIIIASLASGFAVSLIINDIFRSISRKRTEINFSEKDFGEESKIQEKKPEAPKKKTEEKIAEKKTIAEEYKIQAPAIAPAKKSFAPENLPFIDEEYFRNNIIKNVKTTEEKTEKTEKLAETESAINTDTHREPTEEELKKRLNQLLRGEL